MTLGPLLGVGVLPGFERHPASPGVLARIGLGRPDSWGVELQGAVFVAHTILYTNADLHRFHVAALGCRGGTAVVRLDVCGGIAAGALGQLRHKPRPVVDVQIDARVGYRVGGTPLVFSFGAILGVPLIHHDIPGFLRSYRTEPVYGMADLAVGVEVP